ncbi:DMT family transporter [Thalassospira marina]|uniref:EamA family transporter n=1 Tax=Thalassospira marina TaxID=2048283 RepID=A0ABN5FHP8_9PROT|nr:EamA family transporter [Thalassospira marina]AUG54626.1 EamA family transporter [Thalassospira marina]
MNLSRTAFIGELLLLGMLALLWGSSYIFIKIAVAEIPPLTLIALRVSIAAVFLTAIVFGQKQHFPRDAKIWAHLLVQAFFNSIGAWTILAWGQQYVDSGLASVLNSTSPVFLFFISLFLIHRDQINGLKLLGALTGLGGVILIVGPAALNGLGQHLMGQLAVLTGAFLYACSALYGKKFTAFAPSVTAAGTMIWAAIWLIPLCLVNDHPWALRPSLSAISAVIILSVFCTGVALMLYFRLVKTLGPMGVVSQSYLRAGIGVFLGIFILHETPGPRTLAGIAIALAGVVILNWPEKAKPTH